MKAATTDTNKRARFMAILLALFMSCAIAS
jgi:hypothetical protein